MAINKVVYGNNTLIDITDTTAGTGDVVSGKVFYTANGTRSTGSANYVEDVKINNTSITNNGVANIATEGIYDESTNKIATMSDLAGCVGTTSSAPNEAGMTGWDYDNGLIYETRITDNNGDKYINITPSGNKMSVNYGTRDNYLEVGNQSLTLTSIDYDDNYPVNTTFTTNGGMTTLTTQGPGGTGSLDIYSNDTVSLTKINSDNSNSSTVSLSNNKITLYSDTVEVKQAPTTNLGVANKKYVDDAIDALPEPMIFKGSLGTGGTITSLPTASSSNEGYTYKVITAGTYASQSAKVGDTFISDGTAWVLIPSGDEPSGTVTSVTLKATSPIAIDSNSAITSSGTRTLSHANSGVTAGTYKSVTVNATGHVTAGTNPTTLSGYGITDAKIANGVITLGSNTITPLTSSSSLDASKLTGTVPSGCYTNNDIKINGTSIVSNNSANIITNTPYDKDENPIATISDIPNETVVKINGIPININYVANIQTYGTYNASSNKIATMSDIPAIKVNGTSIVSNGVADLKTNTAYNASSNKIATMSDIPNVSGKLDTSKVKTTTSTTSGDVYDVTYINTMLGNVESLLGGI